MNYTLKVQSHRDIESVRHLDSQLESFQQMSPIYSHSKVRSMSYDPIHREILFVEESKPHQIQGTHRTVQTHTVIDQKEFEFGAIALDEITGNVYFVDESKSV